jgi:hypothetical protein
LLSLRQLIFRAVSAHQSNHAKILSLQATSQDLDTQIKETLTLLTSTRSALLSTPSTTFPPSTNTVSYSELLSYARRISKFTLPSSYRETEEQASAETAAGTGEAAGTNTPKESKSGTQTNGTSTPMNGMEKDRDTQMDIDSGTPAPAPAPAPATQQTNNTSLPTEYSHWLNHPPTTFLPWPNEETIRRGALASIQILVDTGVDPADFDPAKSAELEVERKRIVEEDRLREEEKGRLEREREVERRMSVSGGSGELRREEKAKAFQLETFDDDEDD